jgi:DNA-binding MarR family transcriptional regulator
MGETDPGLDLVPLIIAEIYQLAGELRRNAELIARNLGQTQARWQVLSAASEDPKTVPQIARRLGLARQNIQRVADDLVEDGLASFGANPDHKVSPYLLLTKRGHDVIANLQRNVRIYCRELAGVLTTADLIKVRRGLRKICEALDRRQKIASSKSGRKGVYYDQFAAHRSFDH